MHLAWPWAKEQPARGNEVLNGHIAPTIREMQYSGVHSCSATGILNRRAALVGRARGVEMLARESRESGRSLSCAFGLSRLFG